MEEDIADVDRELNDFPVPRNKVRSSSTDSTDSTVEGKQFRGNLASIGKNCDWYIDDIAISDAIREVEDELNKEQKKQGGTPTLLMAAVVIGGIVASQLIPFLFPK